jgi:uncharacterized membrane protein YidH (DUF202 family)
VKYIGSFLIEQLRNSFSLTAFIVGLSNIRASFGQCLTQAQHQVHKSPFVITVSLIVIAFVGHMSTQIPQLSHRLLSVSGCTVTGDCLRSL